MSRSWQRNLHFLLKVPWNTEVSTAAGAVGTGIEQLCVWFGQWVVVLRRISRLPCGAETWNNPSFLCNFLTNSNFWCLKRNDAANAAEVNGSNKWRCEWWGVARSRVFSAQFEVCEQHRCIKLESGSFCGCSKSQVHGKQAELFYWNFSCPHRQGHLVSDLNNLISSYSWWRFGFTP